MVMRSLFDIDSFLWRWLSRLADLMLLNLLFAVCCIPVFTVGAALSALYSVCLKMAVNKEGCVTMDFFQAFKRNFKQATLLWLIMTGIALVFTVNYLCLPLLPNAPEEIMKVLLNIVAGVYIAVWSFLFPIQCKFENSVKNTLKNALALALRHLIPCTLPVSALNIAPILILRSGSETGIAILTFTFIFLFSGIAFLNSKLLLPVFRKYASPHHTE